MSEQKIKDLSTVAWINLVLGIYNLYCFSIGHLLFNLIIGALNVGVWVFFRKPETILLFAKGDAGKRNKN